jgi:hypothetical protein
MSAVGGKSNESKRSFLGIERDGGWWNAAMLGPIAPADSWFGGRRKWRIISLSFN